jgi:predicted alpha/beta hydrolase family esterase
MSPEFTYLIVPGLRDHVEAHWQTHLAGVLRAKGLRVESVPTMGRLELDCVRRIAAIEQAMRSIAGPIVVVAHSGGCIMLAHWARLSSWPIHAALLATPPDFDSPMPEGYPHISQLSMHGWLPVPREPLPFPSIVAASRNDPLGRFDRVAELANDWGSLLVDLGDVGHLNPASGFGPWPRAEVLLAELTRDASYALPARAANE